jgi:hypothetical protein
MKKSLRIALLSIGGLALIIGLPLLSDPLDSVAARIFSELIHRRIFPHWTGYLHTTGEILLVVGPIMLLVEVVINGLNYRSMHGVIWEELKETKSDKRNSTRPLHLNRWDMLIILAFLLIAFLFQIAMMSPGFPEVIFSGDAANILGFAAARAFPERFKNDAILGNLNNIGLYVTIHLPVIIWLQKLVGNFGLAFSLLLFPHVFLQLFSYYLFGRLLFHNRYWALLFSVACASPTALDGGEGWGMMGDALPRFTFQVLIPFVLILLLSTWREKPNRWPWIMVIAGLMAFIHPVSTPAWGFALWLGFWPILPSEWNPRRKIQEMFKLGCIFALALLPYIGIYLTYHQGGMGNSNYDLVHLIIAEYFPSNIQNIPAAVNTLIRNTAQFGLLWYGLIGFILTWLLFPSERPRLKQMLTWIFGIIIVSILVPLAEIAIENTYGIIPLQTELMRSMRYLVPFLFVFWFYPLAEITRRAAPVGFRWGAFIVGTVLALSWLMLNPPEPFKYIPSVLNCWQTGHFICPCNTQEADALTYIREVTPQQSKFTVFFTNRWSGIEVRYLGLRPMVYVYKDKGQLLFTNLNSLEQWNTYQNLENDIFKLKDISAQRKGIVEFARNTGADYILTDFSFPAEAQLQLNVTAVYQNSKYTILKPNAISPSIFSVSQKSIMLYSAHENMEIH